jgi:hypothetical protein
MNWHIGCSGFHYNDWKIKFYPEGLPQKSGSITIASTLVRWNLMLLFTASLNCHSCKTGTIKVRQIFVFR